MITYPSDDAWRVCIVRHVEDCVACDVLINADEACAFKQDKAGRFVFKCRECVQASTTTSP